MANLAGKVALITGAARGQGRAHALALAGAGADIIALDACTCIETVQYAGASAADLAETAELVEHEGRRIVPQVCDVRDLDSLRLAVAAGIAELGGLDIVIANAGILNTIAPSWELSEQDWRTMIDINLTGVWHTTTAVIPHLIGQGRGGSIVLISSVAGLRGIPNAAHYVAAKHGVLGLSRALANELAVYRIRVNSIHPTNVRTTMIDNEANARIYRPDLDNPTLQDTMPVLADINLWPIPWVETADVANAVLWLASDDARYVTGVALPVDLGAIVKYSGA